MKRVTAEWPTTPRTKDSQHAAIAFAGILIVMALTQLFSFEKFIPLLEGFHLPGSAAAMMFAATLVVSAVLAAPFLLGMKLSRAMRWVSMVAGWLVAGVWLFLTIWVNINAPWVDNIGFLGASVTLTPGWWAVSLVVSLGFLAAWAAWGLWPGRRTSLESRPKR